MCENSAKQQTSQENEANRLKRDLLALIQESIPGVPTPEETDVFMQTGMIPPTWWGEIFTHDTSPDQLRKMRNLMDFIHDDFSGESPENIAACVEGEVSGIHLEKNEANGLPVKIGAENVSGATEIPPEKSQGKVSAEQIPKKPRKTPTQSLWRKSAQKKEPSEKRQLTERELAEKLFSGLINSAMNDKTLDLARLRALVAQNLNGHTVSHNPGDKVLTLYDDTNNLAATFSAKELDVIST